MIELKTEYPVIMPDGSLNRGLIKHWAEDENGKTYPIKQLETNIVYEEAIDIYPCLYTYVVAEYDKDVTDKYNEDMEEQDG